MRRGAPYTSPSVFFGLRGCLDACLGKGYGGVSSCQCGTSSLGLNFWGLSTHQKTRKVELSCLIISFFLSFSPAVCKKKKKKKACCRGKICTVVVVVGWLRTAFLPPGQICLSSSREGGFGASGCAQERIHNNCIKHFCLGNAQHINGRSVVYSTPSHKHDDLPTQAMLSSFLASWVPGHALRPSELTSTAAVCASHLHVIYQ